jgi:hypothetical protein
MHDRDHTIEKAQCIANALQVMCNKTKQNKTKQNKTKQKVRHTPDNRVVKLHETTLESRLFPRRK